MRAWARENGYEVADRGRLPAEIADAYTAAHANGGRTASPASTKVRASSRGAAAKPARPARAVRPAKAAPVKTAPAKTAPAKPAASTDDAPTAVDAPAVEERAPAGAGPKPSRVTDDRRLVALAEELGALAERVAKLEKAVGGGKEKDKGKTSRFRRRS